MSSGYLHGYDDAEQLRLIDQAAYMRDAVILPGLEDYRAGDRVLDIGCGVGAVLGEIARHTPGLSLAGIDLEPRQIDYARRYLAGLGHAGADLRIGNATMLPWKDGAFDRVFTMWFFEHLRDGMPVMHEALRVLRPGGTITCVETDYATFKAWPQNPDWDLLERAQHDHFRAHGDAHAGRALATRLAAAGFVDVRPTLIPFHLTSTNHQEALRRHVEYIAGFLGPAVPGLQTLGFDRAALLRGVEFLRTLWQNPEGSVTNVIYRVRASKPA